MWLFVSGKPQRLQSAEMCSRLWSTVIVGSQEETSLGMKNWRGFSEDRADLSVAQCIMLAVGRDHAYFAERYWIISCRGFFPEECLVLVACNEFVVVAKVTCCLWKGLEGGSFVCLSLLYQCCCCFVVTKQH